MAGYAFRKFLLPFDRVMVEKSTAETVTKDAIMLPEKSQGKLLQATVVAVGSGSKGGEIQLVSVKVRDLSFALLPEYGGTKVVIDDRIISYLEMVTFLGSMKNEIADKVLSHKAAHSSEVLRYLKYFIM